MAGNDSGLSAKQLTLGTETVSYRNFLRNYGTAQEGVGRSRPMQNGFTGTPQPPPNAPVGATEWAKAGLKELYAVKDEHYQQRGVWCGPSDPIRSSLAVPTQGVMSKQKIHEFSSVDLM
jgi:hypothetical protein